LTEVVALHGLGKTYDGPPAHTALHDIDLVIDAGEFLAIQGRSGSGKSTLLNILGLLDHPTEGSYHLAGVDVADLTEGDRTWLRATGIGFVFQSFELLRDRSAVENVMLGLLYRGASRATARERSAQALDRVGLAHRSAHLPTQMSGGERQRVAIARAIVGEPDLLLCDEPTGNLDTDSAATVMDVFSGINRDGTTIALITHEPDVADAGSRTVRLADGRLL
jgi:putative ABC transport system ATP-binding protein